MKKIRIFALLLTLILVLSFQTELRAEDNINNQNSQDNVTKIEVRTTAEAVIADTPIEVDIYLRNDVDKIVSLDALLEINEDVFYPITSNDFQPKINMNVFTYDESNQEIEWVWRDGVNNHVIASITIIPKVTLEEGTRVELFRIYDMYTVTDNDVQHEYEEQRCSLLVRKENGVIEADEPLDPRESSVDLYLNTDIYKIGDEDITEYHRGDDYISRVKPKTTIGSFKSHLTTNEGNTINVYKIVGNEVVLMQDNEFVGTGMKLVVSNGTDSIEVDIAVMGDIDGNGKVTISDLVQINRMILRVSQYQEFDIHYIAADLDESDEVTISDLVKENKVILKIATL